MTDKEFNLSEKIGWVESYKICDYKDVHPSHAQAVFEIEDVKKKIQDARKRLKEEVSYRKNSVLDKNQDWWICDIIDKIFLEEFGESLI